MKDLLSKEHQHYKIHTILLKTSFYPNPSPFLETMTPYIEKLCPHTHTHTHTHMHAHTHTHTCTHTHMHVFAPLPQFFKNLKPPINKGEGSHYVHSVYLFYAYLHAKKQSLTPISLTDIDQRYWQSLLGKNLL